MHRRSFTTGIIAAVLTAPMLLTGGKAFASTDNDGPGIDVDGVPQFGRLTLTVNHHRVTVSQLLIANPQGMLGVDLRSPVLQYNEHRLSLGKVPLLNKIFRQPVADRFDGAHAVGQVFLHNGLLMIAPQSAPVFDVSNVVIAHRKRTWETTLRSQVLQTSNIPTLADAQNNGTVLGAAYRTARELLVHIRPSIVAMPS